MTADWLLQDVMRTEAAYRQAEIRKAALATRVASNARRARRGRRWGLRRRAARVRIPEPRSEDGGVPGQESRR